jgi:hypothetical protein
MGLTMEVPPEARRAMALRVLAGMTLRWMPRSRDYVRF